MSYPPCPSLKMKIKPRKPTEADVMLKVFEASIATGVFPKPGSPCHKKLREIIGMAALPNNDYPTPVRLI